MSDLAESIVALASNAKGRQVAHKQLKQAVATVARAITEQCAEGDTIQLGSTLVQYKVIRVTWTVDGNTFPRHPDGALVLTRSGAEDINHKVRIGSALFSPRAPYGDLPPAPAPNDQLEDMSGGYRELASFDDMIAFTTEVQDLVDALIIKTARDTQRASMAAEQVSKVTIR